MEPNHSHDSSVGIALGYWLVGTRGYFPGGKAAGACSWPLTSIYCRGQRMRGAVHPLSQYAFMALWLVKAQG